MQDFTIRTFQADDRAEVISLWRDCGLIVPWNDPGADIARKQSDSPDLFFIGEVDGELIASCMAGYDGHRGWIYYLAVKRSRQGKGYAAKLVAKAESELMQRGCPKIDLMVRKTNDNVISFYESIGYSVDPVVVLSKRLVEDNEQEQGRNIYENQQQRAKNNIG